MAHTRTALITNGSHGIGYHVCRALAGRGTRVILHASTPGDAHTAVDRLISDGADPALLHPVAADYRCLDEVMSLATDLDRNHDRLDLLVNNPGALTMATSISDRSGTPWKTNYLAPYVLTRLVGRILNAADARIVTVVASLHRDRPLDLDSPCGDAATPPAEAYAQAQHALVLFTRALALSTEGRVTAVAVHPGYLNTAALQGGYGVAGLPPALAAVHVLRAADPAVAVVNGGLYQALQLAEPSPVAGDATAALHLWRATARTLGWDYTAARMTNRGTPPCRTPHRAIEKIRAA